ncbi:MAG: low molecular weight protein arginine phosphatase [Clostridia bacterium]|nr:low molecular weight protein arginine phosphatase [Clostridia bacterium]
MKVIFVCMGNTCRSPMAEGIYKKLHEGEDMEIGSRGIVTSDGFPDAENAIEIMKQMGIDISEHKSKRITKEDLDADKIFCMTEDIYSFFVKNGVDKERLEVLGGGIFDPYGGDLEVYRMCAEKITESLRNK